MKTPLHETPVYVYTSPLIQGISHDLIYPVVLQEDGAQRILQTQGPKGVVRTYDADYDPKEQVISITRIPHTDLYVIHTIDGDNINNIYVVSRSEIADHLPTP